MKFTCWSLLGEDPAASKSFTVIRLSDCQATLDTKLTGLIRSFELKDY